VIPVTQTKVVIKNSKGDEIVRGNCFAAAIASMLELPITEVPNVEVLFDVDDTYYIEVMHAFLKSKGYELFTDDRYKVFHPELEVQLRAPAGEDLDEWADRMRCELKDQYYLVSGETVRGYYHVCIYQNGVLVHDPFPTREGLIKLEHFRSLDKIPTMQTDNKISLATNRISYLLIRFFQSRSDAGGSIEATQQETLEKDFEKFVDDINPECFMCETMHEMCIESLSPEMFEKWKEVCDELYRNRQRLQGHTSPYEVADKQSQ
jgi:hypothetical protein